MRTIAFGLTPSSVTLTASPNPAAYGQAVTITAVVTAGATGIVTFYDGAIVLGSANVSAGQSVFATRMLNTGVRSLRAYYAGDATYGASSSASLPQTVNSAVSQGFRQPLNVLAWTGAGGASVAIPGDFNGDGKLDLLTGHSIFPSGSFDIIPGHGDGTFGPGTHYDAAGYTVCFLAADFNGDGKLDVATASLNANDVSIYLGNGDGTLSPAVNFPIVYAPYSMVSGDFNGDGKIDLAVGTPYSKLAVFIGNGDGTFQAPTYVIIDGICVPVFGCLIRPYGLAAADLNNDGKTDLLVGSNASFQVFLGAGDGSFNPGAIYQVDPYGNLQSLTIADFEADGKADVVAGTDANRVFIYRGNGDGTLQEPVNWGARGPSFVTADFNGDGKTDIVGDNFQLSGNGSGGFSFVQGAVNSGGFGGLGFLSMATGDFNGDGRVAVVTVNGAYVKLYLGGAGDLSTPVLGVASTHTGDFALIQTGATYTLTVSNNGPAPTSGTVTLIDTLPSGMTAIAMSGSGWTCTLATLTCTREDALPAGQSYPAITLTVNLARDTPGVLDNLVWASSPGAVGATAYDVSRVGIALLSASITHTGRFARGQTDAILTITVSNPAGPISAFGPVTVSASITNPDLTLVGMAGTGWTCVSTTCTRSDTLPGGASYPPIALTVSVSTSATQPQASVTVSGPFVARASALDYIEVGCSYLLSGSGSFTALAAQGSFTIATRSVCSWAASTGTPWLHITSSSSGSGGATLSFTVDANSSASSRSGSISISGTPFSITQEAGSAGLRFVPITPCRVADTRGATSPLGGPALAGGASREFDIRASACGLPSSALAYALNLTVVPSGSLGFLSVWPAGQSQPGVSTLNSLDGRIKANAAIVPAGTGGAISLYASNTTNAIIDINGYFVPAVGNANLQFYPVTPCRVADTRGVNGTWGGPALTGGVTRSFPVNSTCGIPAGAQALALNLTVAPSGSLGFLSAWPTGQSQPGASTLNAPTGGITANAAIIPAGTGGAVNLYATSATDVIIDINGYFAPPGIGGMDFYTATPCRIADTRGATGPYGQPQLAASVSRVFSVAGSGCGIPGNAGGYSLNTTVAPPGSLGFLTLWGAGSQPSVSTLNAGDGAITANAAIIPAGGGGAITAYASHATHLIVDINGYFQ